MGTKLVSTGSCLPSNCLTNEDVAKIVKTSDEWIVRRTGIKSRHILSREENPSTMGVKAASKALEQGGVDSDAVDLLIVATNFPDMMCPGSSPFIAAELGLGQTPFFDLKAGCSGFVYALCVAHGLIESGLHDRILLIGTEALSRVADWSDRRTCVLFGDGAGAVVLESSQHDGVLGISLHADGEKAELLYMPAGGTRMPASHETVDNHEGFLKMKGSGVYRSAVEMMELSTIEALSDAGLEVSDVDWLVPHQANIRIIDALVKRLGIDREKVVVNLDRVANTSTASIPIALDEAIEDGRVKEGEIVAFTAFGAGATYGSAVLKI